MTTNRFSRDFNHQARGSFESKSLCAFLMGCLILLTIGCSTSSTIRMSDGTFHEGQISGADTENLYLQNQWAYGGSTDAIKKLGKKDIVDIDHPGNVHLLVGGILTGFGALYGGMALLFELSPEQSIDSPAVLFSTGAVMAAVGIPLGVWGWLTWDESLTLAYESNGFVPESRQRPGRILLVPTISNVKNTKMGLSLHLSF